MYLIRQLRYVAQEKMASSRTLGYRAILQVIEALHDELVFDAGRRTARYLYALISKSE